MEDLRSIAFSIITKPFGFLLLCLVSSVFNTPTLTPEVGGIIKETKINEGADE
jgi:hypothetical protein